MAPNKAMEDYNFPFKTNKFAKIKDMRENENYLRRRGDSRASKEVLLDRDVKGEPKDSLALQIDRPIKISLKQ